MREELRKALGRLWLGASVGVGAALMSATPAWAQEPELPPPPAADEPAPSEAAEEATEEAAEDARDAAEDAARQTRERAQEAQEQARDAQREAPAPVRDAARETADEARDAARATVDEARDASGAARDAVRGTGQAARDAVRSTGQAAGDAARATGQAAGAAVRETGQSAGSALRGARAATEFRVEDTRSADIGLWFDRSANDALVISDVAPAGVIANYGFREGDRIVSVNGQRVVREADFVNYLFAPEFRDRRVEVVVLRDGREEMIHVEPAALIREVSVVPHDPLEELGIVLDDRYDDRVVVWKVIRRSPAFYAGLRAGDIITAVNEQRVVTPEDLVHLATKLEGEPLKFDVARGERVRRIDVEVTTVAPQPGVEAPDVEIRQPVVPVNPPAAVPVPVPAPQQVVPPPARPNRPGILPRRRP